MKRIGLILWFAFVIAVTAALGTRYANAQGQGCDQGCWGGQYNWGAQYSEICEWPCPACGGGGSACETDFCGGTCPNGWQSYCIWYGACHQYPGCWNGYCA